MADIRHIAEWSEVIITGTCGDHLDGKPIRFVNLRGTVATSKEYDGVWAIKVWPDDNQLTERERDATGCKVWFTEGDVESIEVVRG